MFLLDTNVISELRKAPVGRADPAVVAWARSQSSGSLYISAITVLELELGVLQIERRDEKQGAVLRNWLNARVLPAFTDRVLPIDTNVAQQCARLHVPDRRSERDCMIAATALVHGMAVSTRNLRDFESTGVALIDPWAFRAP